MKVLLKDVISESHTEESTKKTLVIFCSQKANLLNRKKQDVVYILLQLSECALHATFSPSTAQQVVLIKLIIQRVDK